MFLKRILTESFTWELIQQLFLGTLFFCQTSCSGCFWRSGFPSLRSAGCYIETTQLMWNGNQLNDFLITDNIAK